MIAPRVEIGALLCAVGLAVALAACGERAGDPVVALADDQNLAGASPGADGGGGDAGPGAGGDAGAGNGAGASDAGPVGLCGPCTSSLDCGDANDACVRRQREGPRFCGRDCDDQLGCPDGYECVDLNDSRLHQCVPRSDCAEPRPAPSLSEFQAYVLARVNAERVARGRPPLEPSPCLGELARASAIEFARTDEPLGKFVKECDPIWPACECGWSAQAEVAIAAYDLDWQAAIDRAVASNGTNADARFVRALLADDATQIGIGFWLSGDELWIALSFD